MSRYAALKQEAYEANRQLPGLGLVLSTFGNVSACDRSEGVFAIKPSGVPYEELTPDKMVVVDLDGRTVEGSLRPSSDTRTHAVLYRQWSGIGGICHTHSTYATAWAQAQRVIPVFGTTHADHCTASIPCTLPMDEERVRGDYELETGLQIIECFSENELDHRKLEMVLIGNHAPFTWGSDAKKAVYNSAVLEQIAHMALLTQLINPAAPDLNEALMRKHYERKHGAEAYYGQSS